MKLSIDKHPEIIRLEHYFKKIEALAEKMGIDVDDLVHENKDRNSSMYATFRKNILSITCKRVDALFNRSEYGSSPEAPIAGLTIHINRENNN